MSKESKGRGKQGQVSMVFRTHGGKRRGAGRKPQSHRGHRPAARHATRPEHDPRHPVHVTIRVVGNIEGLRRRDLYLALREATIVTAKREDFRITHMSIQRDHLHMIVEAEGKQALSNGIRGFSISGARQINKAIIARGGDRRTGRVIGDRFHARPLTSPRAVRNALAYLFCNWRHHGEDRAPIARTWSVDPFSSGALFFGWKELASSPILWPLPPTYLPLIVFRPRTWLLQSWPRFHPLISVREVPGHA
jgi:REP element-mobilizing transposase RayT